MFRKNEKMEQITNEMFNIVAVKDELTQTFLQPTFGENLDALIRIFKTQINTLPIWKDNPTDFSLYLLGHFDQNTGIIKPELKKIISGNSVKERSENIDIQSVEKA